MYHVDNSTGVPVMPQPSPVTSETELFFTEGGNGVPPTFPGPDWFNIIQSELINILRAAGLDPDKMDNTQILAALKKLFLSRSNPFGDIKADGAAAIATALSNLQLGEAAKRDVGSGAGQVPDMSSFQSGGGWFKLPSGYVIQAFVASFDSNGLYINFPIPFPSSVIAIVPGVLMSTTASPSQQFPSIQRDVNDLTRFFAKYNMGGMNASYFIAIGK
ncbi:gp53-like domain-containing protein [Escherichia coli]